jgi:hypothetical protein
MITKVTITICAALAAGTLAAFGNEEPKATTGSTSQEPNERMRKIDAEVTKVEEKMPKLTRKETTLKPGALVKATDEKWTKIHTYSDGKKIERLKVYPPAGSQKTEEFYYDNNQLVLVFIEPAGAGKAGHDTNAKGTKYYFHNKGLFAVMSDGKMIDPLDDKARAMGKKLQRESKIFREAAK